MKNSASGNCTKDRDRLDKFRDFYINDPKCKEILLNKLRTEEKYPPNLDIISSEGIATDVQYIKAYLSHDVLLSSEKEFMHDQFAHVIPTIRLMFVKRVSGYQKLKAQISKLIDQTYRPLPARKGLAGKENKQ